MTYEAFKEKIFEAGIIGAGGAGFPTHFKLDQNMDYLIINGAECEPLITTDYEIMNRFSEEIVTMIEDMLKILDVKKAVWAVKEKHAALIEKLETLTSFYDNIEICKLSNIYPVGDELTLIYKCTDIIIPKGQLPSSKKIMTLNVETLFNMYQCIYHSQPVIDKYVTLAGAVETPKVIKVPLGMPLKEVLKEVNITTPEYDILLGGPMMGSFVSPETKITKTTKAIILLPKESWLYTKKKATDIGSIKRAMSCCSQCQMCTDLCPRNRLGHKVEPHKLMNAFANGLVQNSAQLHTALGCCGCNTCSYYACHHDLDPADLMMMVKRELMKQGIKPTGTQEPKLAGIVTAEVPSSRLLSKLGLKAYEHHGMLEEDEVTTSRVYIPLTAHIGKKSIPIVNVGDAVKKGQKVADGKISDITATMHSSIEGIVKRITETEIIIERR